MSEVYHHREHELRKFIGKTDIHSKKWKNTIDNTVYVVGIVGVFMALPQVIKIFALKNAEGLSFIFWMTYIVTAFFWTLYGVAHKSKQIIVINICWLLVDILVVVGIILYGKGFW